MNSIKLPIAELKPALAGLGKIIAKRSTLPVLSCIRIDRTKDGWITLTGTDLDAFVTVRLEEPTTGEPASILVPFEDLTKTMKSCAAGEAITVEQSFSNPVILRYPVGQQSAEIKLDFIAPEEFPPIPKIKIEPVTLNDNIRASLLEAMECASADETRYILRGAFIDVSDKKCNHIVGTDGKHLFSSNSFSLPLNESVIVPTHKFLGWKEFSNDGEWQLRVEPGKSGGKGYIQISSRRWRFIHRQVEGNYPNWRQVIPNADQFKSSVKFEPPALKDLIQVIKRMPDHDQINHRIGVRIVGKKVRFVSQDDEKQLEVPIYEALAEGKEITVYLNRTLLVKAFEFDLSNLDIIDETSPLRFHDNQGRQMVVMPIRPDAVTPVPAKSPEPPATNTNQPPEEAQQERKPTMRHQNGGAQSAASNGASRSTTSAATEKPALENALAQIEIVRGDFRNAIAGLNKLGEALKTAQREQKTADKEVQAARQTLEKLQSVRI